MLFDDGCNQYTPMGFTEMDQLPSAAKQRSHLGYLVYYTIQNIAKQKGIH
jgi:hypothetical protein